jgi:hypothetical protein
MDFLLDFFDSFLDNLTSCISQFAIIFLLFNLFQYSSVRVNSWLFSVFLLFLSLFVLCQFFTTFDFLWWWWQICHLALLVTHVKHIAIFESKFLNCVSIPSSYRLSLGLIFKQLEIFWISDAQSVS